MPSPETNMMLNVLPMPSPETNMMLSVLPMPSASGAKRQCVPNLFEAPSFDPKALAMPEPPLEIPEPFADNLQTPGPTNSLRTLAAVAELSNAVESNQGIMEKGVLDAKCVRVLDAAALDTSDAVLLATTEGARIIAKLQARVRSLELELQGFQDVAQKLEDVCRVAASMPASESGSAPGSPAPWFTDAALGLPFSLPSLRASPGCENQSIGSLLVSDLQHNSFEQLCQRYERQTPHVGSGAEASTIGGNSGHGGSECGGAMWAASSRHEGAY